MKVLFVDHPEADYLAGIVYLGLTQELGAENVYDYPYKKSYHGEIHRYPNPYAPDPYPVAGQNDGVTAPFSWMPAIPGHEVGRGEVCERIGEFDVVVLASPRTWAVRALDEIIATVGRSGIRKLVAIDGEDYDVMRWDVVGRFSPNLYCKREYLEHGNYAAGCRVLPFPFASPVPELPRLDKNIDVLFLGGNTWPGRQAATSALANAFGDRFVGGAGVSYSYPEYLDAIARSRIAISVRGFGYDTLRYWEIPSFDTLLFADKLPLVKPHPFVHGQTSLVFHDTQSLVDGVRCALEDAAWREGIATAGNAHLRAHHTARARARQMLDAALL